MNTYPIPIPMEDPLQHTQERPFCDDPSCPCHEDQTLIAILFEQINEGLLQPEEANRILANRQI